MAIATGNVTFSPVNLQKMKNSGVATAQAPVTGATTQDGYAGSVQGDSAGLMPKPSGWAGGSYGLQGPPEGYQFKELSNQELQKRVDQGAKDQDKYFNQAIRGMVLASPDKNWMKASEGTVNEGMQKWIGTEAKRDASFAGNLASALKKKDGLSDGEAEALDRFQDQKQVVQVEAWADQLSSKGIMNDNAKLVYESRIRVDQAVGDMQGAARELWQRAR